MFKIDCLLKNTDVKDAAQAVMEYIGTSRAAEGKDASLNAIYREMRKNGVEIDKGTAAHIYSEVLSTKNHPSFNTHEQVREIAGEYQEEITRNLLLKENEKGEKQISEMSPTEATLNNLVKLFKSDKIQDKQAKSMLRTIQDKYTEFARKTVPNPDKSGKPDTRTFEEIGKQALDNKSLGYKDTVTGAINGFNEMHDSIKELMKTLDAEVKKGGDPVLQQQWDTFSKSIQNSVMTLIFSTAEGKKVLMDALKTPEGGSYVKTLKDGTEIPDYKRIAGSVKSINQFKDNVIKAFEAKGFNSEDAKEIANSLHKEYLDLRAKSLELNRKDQEQKTKTKTPEPDKPQGSIGEMVNKAIAQSESYAGQKAEAGAEGIDVSKHKPELTFSKSQQSDILYDSLKNSEFNKIVGEGEKQIDWKELALNKPESKGIPNPKAITPEKLNKIIVDHLVSNEGVKPKDAQKVADKLINDGAHKQLLQDITDHGEAALKAQEKQISKDVLPTRKSDMRKLAELGAMGIFNGAHDDLLHHVLGIESSDQAARKDLMEIMKLKQQLMQQLGPREYLYQSMNAELQHKVNSIIQKNIANKTTLGKIAKALSDYTGFVNMGIIGNAFNIGENTTSGLIANIGQTLGLFRKMGPVQAMKVVYQMNRLWMATFKDVSKGGIHYGLEGGKFSQHSELADKYSLKNWKQLGWGGKALTALTAYARAGLNAMDSAFKVSLHQKTTMLNLHKALTEVPDENGHKMSRDEANEYLNEKLFGKSLDDAKNTAEYIYGQMGIKADKNHIERSARELVQANVFSGGKINEDVIEAAIKSAYKVASIGLGHEAREGVLGILPGMLKSLQSVTQKGYDKLEKSGHHNAAAAYHILAQTILVNGVFKFSFGVANWIVLRPITNGIGLLTGAGAK